MSSWEKIDENIRNKLIGKGFDDIVSLPNTINDPTWNNVRDECDLSLRELIAVKNNCFPVVVQQNQGNYYYFNIYKFNVFALT